MNKALSIGILIMICLASMGLARGQEVVADSGYVSLRYFDDAQRQEYLDDDDFLYDRRPVNQDEGVWRRILRSIQHWWNQLFADSSPLWIRILVYGCMLAFVIGTLLYVFQVKIGGIFGRSAKQISVDFAEMPTDIHALDFDSLVQEAVNAGEYRKAVRLLYLESLKILSSRGWIDWQINKTNHDYQLELQSTPVALPFDDLTLHYEHVWYGDFPIDATRYHRIEQIFRNFQIRLSNKA
ncbi:MAG: DUF4129 domain-containing protein [Bacteroidota bacterium]